MISIRKFSMSFALAIVILFGSAFMPATSNPLNFISFKPVMVSASTSQFKVNGITYEIAYDYSVSVIGCDATTSAFIPSYVTYNGISYKVEQISASAFQNNTTVSTITISNNVNYVEADTFIGCTDLYAINVSMYNQYYFSYDGVLYNKAMTELVKYPPLKTGSYFYMPYNVGTVYWNAFNGCRYLEEIYISPNASNIFYNAFNNCIKLREINVSSDNNYYCSKNGVLYTKDGTMLVKYPGALTDTSFTIDKDVISINESTFSDAINLNTFYVEAGNLNMKAIDGVLFKYDTTELLSYPAAKAGTIYYVPSTVTNIYQYAFLNSQVTDIRNLDRRINVYSETNFITNSSITQINGSSTLTSENTSFIINNIINLEKTSIVINTLKAKVNEAQKYLNDNYQFIKNSYPNASDGFIKAKAMHDWLCSNTQYLPTAKEAYGIDIYGPWDIPSQEVQKNYKYSNLIQSGVTKDSQSNCYYVDDIECAIYHRASGALLMPFTVCEGYALAYQLLMESVSVKCEVIQGNHHAWNLVIIDGKYYSVDCCHDDNGTSGYNYSHFLKTKESLMQICSTHSDEPTVKNDDGQFALVFNVTGQNHNRVTYESIKSSLAQSDYNW